MDNISIRSAGPDDLSTVAELRWRWARENGTRPVTSREEFVGAFLAWAQQNRESHRCLVALRDGVIVGMAWLATLRRVPHPGSLDRSSADLQCVYVVPEQRNAGAGGRLIDAVLAHAGDLGVERVTVHSSVRATTAYRRHGFVQSPRLLDFDLAGG